MTSQVAALFSGAFLQIDLNSHCNVVLRPMRWLTMITSLSLVAAGRALVANLRRGHYEVTADLPSTIESGARSGSSGTASDRASPVSRADRGRPIDQRISAERSSVQPERRTHPAPTLRQILRWPRSKGLVD